ncbi:MAG: Crp/Fnr family transcriptional regulator [Rhodocyclales bacterium GT-UBC]|nr:MAG: Crp/Fnr family transcriptional regulator [Rhodocyclales bacterium GT-UBC]
MPVPFQWLTDIPLLRPLPQEALMRISTQMCERKFARREVVISKEQTRFELGFLIEGRLQGVDFTVDGRGVGLYFVEPGDYFGELSVVDGLGAAEHVIAAAKSTAIFLDAEPARHLIFENPTLAQGIMTRLSARVRSVSAQRTLLGLPNPFQRLCVQLLQLARNAQAEQPLLDPAPTHQELAIMINASRETVTRAFQVLTLHQAIAREGSQLRLLRPDFLSDVGEGKIDPPKT